MWYARDIYVYYIYVYCIPLFFSICIRIHFSSPFSAYYSSYSRYIFLFNKLHASNRCVADYFYFFFASNSYHLDSPYILMQFYLFELILQTILTKYIEKLYRYLKLMTFSIFKGTIDSFSKQMTLHICHIILVKLRK